MCSDFFDQSLSLCTQLILLSLTTKQIFFLATNWIQMCQMVVYSNYPSTATFHSIIQILKCSTFIWRIFKPLSHIYGMSSYAISFLHMWQVVLSATLCIKRFQKKSNLFIRSTFFATSCWSPRYVIELIPIITWTVALVSRFELSAHTQTPAALSQWKTSTFNFRLFSNPHILSGFLRTLKTLGYFDSLCRFFYFHFYFWYTEKIYFPFPFRHRKESKDI